MTDLTDTLPPGQPERRWGDRLVSGAEAARSVPTPLGRHAPLTASAMAPTHWMTLRQVLGSLLLGASIGGGFWLVEALGWWTLPIFTLGWPSLLLISGDWGIAVEDN